MRKNKEKSNMKKATITPKVDPKLVGMKKWCSQYVASGPPCLEELTLEVETFISKFEAKEEAERARAKEMKDMKDDEGWTTVTKVGKKKVAPRTEHHEARLTARQKKKIKEKELLSFYAWQSSNAKKDHLLQLQKKFEEDKQKIAEMRAARKFKPY